MKVLISKEGKRMNINEKGRGILNKDPYLKF